MQTIGIIGGTGDLGSGLALRFARAGCTVIIGSRDAERAAATASDLNAAAGTKLARGTGNLEAAQQADIVVLAVKFSNQRETLEQIRAVVQGKIVVDTTVPLVPPAVARVQLPPGGSAAVIAQQILGDKVQVVSAFQNVAASALRQTGTIDCDVLVTGDSETARQVIIDLAEASGLRAWHAGVLANSAAAEALTSVLIGINKRYKSDHTGIRITGAERH